jgi:hypothetical protein
MQFFEKERKQDNMGFTQTTLVSAIGLFIGMVVCMEQGRRIACRKQPGAREDAQRGVSAVEGAVFALLGLLIAFSFSGAASRFEARRLLIGQEANAIGTAYLRIDTLPKIYQQELRDLFRSYLDVRIYRYKNLENPDQAAVMAKKESALQGQIWAKSVTATSSPASPPSAAMLMLPALNDMIDITTTRSVAAQNHPPRIIFIMLSGLSLLSALLAGYGMSSGRRSLLHVISYAAALSITVFVILDLEHPRHGLIRIDNADRVLIELQQGMKQPG